MVIPTLVRMIISTFGVITVVADMPSAREPRLAELAVVDWCINIGRLYEEPKTKDIDID